MKTGIDGSGKKNLSCITFLLAFYVILTTSFTGNPENFWMNAEEGYNSTSENNIAGLQNNSDEPAQNHESATFRSQECIDVINYSESPSIMIERNDSLQNEDQFFIFSDNNLYQLC